MTAFVAHEHQNGLARFWCCHNGLTEWNSLNGERVENNSFQLRRKEDFVRVFYLHDQRTNHLIHELNEEQESEAYCNIISVIHHVVKFFSLFFINVFINFIHLFNDNFILFCCEFFSLRFYLRSNDSLALFRQWLAFYGNHFRNFEFVTFSFQPIWSVFFREFKSSNGFFRVIQKCWQIEVQLNYIAWN